MNSYLMSHITTGYCHKISALRTIWHITKQYHQIHLYTPGDMPFTLTHTWCHYNSFLHIPGDILFTFTVYTHLHGDILFTFTHTCCHKSKSSLHTPFIHFYTHLGTFHSPLHIPYVITLTYTWCLYIHL